MVVDCVGDSFLKYIPTGRLPLVIGYDAKHDRVYLPAHVQDDATVVDCAGDSVIATIGLGLKVNCVASATNENKVYVGGESFRRVIAIDAATNRVVAEIPVPGRVRKMCYNPALSKLYYTDQITDSVTVIDCTTDRVVARVGVGGRPDYLAYSPVGGSKVYCANREGQAVAVIDCLRDSVVARVDIGVDAWDLLVNTVEEKVYCNARGDTVVVIDCHGDTVLRRGNFRGEGLVYNPTANKAYFGDGFLRVVDGVSDTVIATVDTIDTNGWVGGCYNSRDDKVYVSLTQFLAPDYLLILDGTTDSLLAALVNPAGGLGVRRPIYNPVNNKVYLPIIGDDFVAVFDGATDSLLRTVPTKHSPWQAAWNPTYNRTYVACYLGSSISVLRDSMVPGVEEGASHVLGPGAFPAILRRGASVLAREDLAILDCTGRRVMAVGSGTRAVLGLPPGVYFAVSCERGPARRFLVVD